MSEFKVRALDSAGQPSVQEKEQQNQAQLDLQQQQQTPPAPEPPAKPSIEEGDVLSFIKERYKKEVSSIDDLLVAPQQPEQLPEDVSAFLKYKKETGRGIGDFM